MRRIVALLVIASACGHGRVDIHIRDVARSAGELRGSDRVTVPAALHTDGDWWRTTAKIQRDDHVEVVLTRHAVGENEIFSGFARPTIGDLLRDCPPSAFDVDEATRRANPRCMLLAVDGETMTVGTRRYPSPVVFGLLGVAAGLGIVTCVAKCDTPYSGVATGAMIVGGVVAIGAAVAVVMILNKGR